MQDAKTYMYKHKYTVCLQGAIKTEQSQLHACAAHCVAAIGSEVKGRATENVLGVGVGLCAEQNLPEGKGGTHD